MFLNLDPLDQRSDALLLEFSFGVFLVSDWLEGRVPPQTLSLGLMIDSSVYLFTHSVVWLDGAGCVHVTVLSAGYYLCEDALSGPLSGFGLVKAGLRRRRERKTLHEALVLRLVSPAPCSPSG